MKRPKPQKPTKFRRSPSSYESRTDTTFQLNTLSPDTKTPTTEASFSLAPVQPATPAKPVSRLYEELKAIRDTPKAGEQKHENAQEKQKRSPQASEDALFELQKQLEMEKLNNLKI